MSHKENSQSLGRHSGVAAGAPSPISVMKSNGAGGDYYSCHKNANGPFFPGQVGKENCPAGLLTDMVHWFPEAPFGPGYSL